MLSGADAPPHIHVGYHKTATSWLQATLFRREDLGFWKVRGPAVTRNLILPNALDFDAASCRRALAPLVASGRARGLLPVVSNERLSGSPHSGGWDSKELAERVAAVYPGAKVLLCVREQRSIILSAYKEYVRIGGPAGLSDYLSPPARGREEVPWFDLSHFEYDRLVARYLGLFGRENVRVVAYEVLLEDAYLFASEIAGFFDAGVATEALDRRMPLAPRRNVALSGAGVMVKARLNRLLSRDRLNPGTLVPLAGGDRLLERLTSVVERYSTRAAKQTADRALRERVSDAVGDRYRASNLRLEQLTGLDLAALGYDLDRSPAQGRRVA